MQPLNLMQAPPRSPRERLNEFCTLPRMIDIARAHLPGGRSGEYQIGRGMSMLVLATLGIDRTQFIQIVGESSNETEVARRLSADEGNTTLLQLTTRLERLTVSDIPLELRPEFERFYGRNLPADRAVFDVLAADDAASFDHSSSTQGPS